MALPESLIAAAQEVAGDDVLDYIAVWEGASLPADPLLRPLLLASPGVCAVGVMQGDRRCIRPFIWTADLSPEAARVAHAIYELGVTENVVEAATALSDGGGA